MSGVVVRTLPLPAPAGHDGLRHLRHRARGGRPEIIARSAAAS